LHVYAALDLPKEPVFVVRVLGADGRPSRDRTFYLGPGPEKRKTTDLSGEIPLFAGQSTDVKLWHKDGNRFLLLKETARDGAGVTLRVPEPTYVVRFVDTTDNISLKPLARTQVFEIVKQPVSNPVTEPDEGKQLATRGLQPGESAIVLPTDDNGEIAFYEEASMDNLRAAGSPGPKFVPLTPGDKGRLRLMHVPPAYRIRLVNRDKTPRPGQKLFIDEVEERTTNEHGEISFARGAFGEQTIYIKPDPGSRFVKLLRVADEGNVVLVDEHGPPPPPRVSTGGSPGGPPPPPPPQPKVGTTPKQPPPSRSPMSPSSPPPAAPPSQGGSPPPGGSLPANPGNPGTGGPPADDD
jgi:hypothetical protein